MKIIVALAAGVVLVATGIGAQEASKQTKVQMAALALPTGVRADWQQWDSFLTFVTKRLGQDFGADQREQLGDAFLDARYQLVRALASGISDPVPQLFLDTWNRLSPILKQALPGVSQQTASQYTSFATAMDAAASVGDIARRLGFFRITPDTLRGAANLLGQTNVDPLAYTIDMDSELRSLLGFTGELPTPRPSPALERSRLRNPRVPDRIRTAFGLSALAYAAEPDLTRLNQWVPDAPELDDYLGEVRELLDDVSDRVMTKTKLPAEHQSLYRQIVFAAAWQESCWRQFIKKGTKLAPLASATGDVGLMQVNRNTWRGLYDVKGLNGDIGYNGHAGAEILQYYLARYAIRKKEHQQPGGNLARATYAAYNGGPSHLGRYRSTKPVPALKKVDDAFWAKFQSVSSGQELAVKSCYGR
ncbi:MAG TPA: transglycosylase SLT domain-containing protein [Candidatus Binatia bacterium]|nr:transglycosylase SLT domain-containing protein [Candidatus Binatia bacterium]